MNGEWLVLVESNTTGSGRTFCAAARSIGLRPILFARDPDCYAYVGLDRIESRRVDTKSPNAVFAAAVDLVERGGAKIAGVTSSSEYYIDTASQTAQSLGLTHADPSAIRACRDKGRQRRILESAGVPSPAFSTARTPAEAVATASRIGLPVVVKPVAGSGSVGVRKCRTRSEVGAAVSYILTTHPAQLGLPRQSAVVVERYLDGAEYSVEVMDTTVIGIAHKHLGSEPYFVEIGHDVPAPLAAVEASRISETATAALTALGLGVGPAHVELRRTAEGPHVIEVNPRLAGGMLPRVVLEASGIDVIRHVVAAAAGRAEPIRKANGSAASIRFLVGQQSGRIRGIRGVEEARSQPGVVEVGLTCQVGQRLTLRRSFLDRLAYVIAAAPHSAEAAQACEAGLSRLEPWIAPVRGNQARVAGRR